MWYLLTALWPFVAIALVFGLAFGWWTSEREPSRSSPTAWYGWLFIAALIAALIAFFQVYRGQMGLIVDAALTLAAAYFLGCCLGCLFRHWTEPSLEAAVAGGGSQTMARASASPAPAPAPVKVSAPAPAPAPAEPAASPAVEGESAYAGVRPQGFVTAREGKGDDLKLIKGIGPQNEARLHGLGIWHFDQIAKWTEQNALWVGSYLAFPGRIEREDWVTQAKALAAGVKTEFAKRVERGEVASSLDDGSKGRNNVDVVAPRSTPKGEKPKS